MLARQAKIFSLVILLFVGFLIIVKSLGFYSPDFSRGYLSNKKDIFDGFFKYGLYAHIASVPFIFLIGTAQIFFRYEFKKGKLHAALGKIYVYLILFISAPGAFIMSFYAFGGALSKASFFILTLLWFWFTFQGFMKGRKKDFSSHQQFMVRSYVLTLSAITLRIISFVFIHFFDFHGELAYTLVAWLSWLPFILLTELILRTKFPKKIY
jgi:uncharacterized membrane protein